MKLDNQEFLTLLLIYGAHVDYNFCQNEQSFIIEKSGRDIFDRIYLLYLSLGESTVQELLLETLRKKYHTQEQRKSDLRALEELFKVDGIYCRFEKSCMKLLTLV